MKTLSLLFFAGLAFGQDTVGLEIRGAGPQSSELREFKNVAPRYIVKSISTEPCRECNYRQLAACFGDCGSDFNVPPKTVEHYDEVATLEDALALANSLPQFSGNLIGGFDNAKVYARTLVSIYKIEPVEFTVETKRTEEPQPARVTEQKIYHIEGVKEPAPKVAISDIIVGPGATIQGDGTMVFGGSPNFTFEPAKPVKKAKKR